MGSGFYSQAPIEFTEEGVIIRDVTYYNERLIFSEDDEDLLMRIAIAEAGNQGVKGMALIMRVVINRWQSGRYGETLKSVIYAQGQFYTAGMYRNDIRSAWDGDLTEGQREQIRQARAALSWITFNWDESDGALYFCSTGWSNCGREKLFKYEAHWGP